MRRRETRQVTGMTEPGAQIERDAVVQGPAKVFADSTVIRPDRGAAGSRRGTQACAPPHQLTINEMVGGQEESSACGTAGRGGVSI